MRLHSLSRTLVLAASAGALIAVSFGNIAHAITDTVFRYSTLKTGYVSLLPAAFAPGDSTTANSYTIAPEFYFLSNSPFAACFDAPVNFPDGARITSLKAWATTTTNDGVHVTLHRANLAGANSGAVADMISHDTSNTRFAMTAAVPNTPAAIVNNEHYGYGAEVCISGSGTLFHSAHITYVYRDAGD
jgi:hypothetical protein